MLQNLSIQNFVIIEHSEIPFSEGFNVITGETGAGKSILLGALSLILGNRADRKTILDENKKTIIEATFLIDNNQFHPFFAANDIDFEQETIIRREITPSGKSRAFINDTPVTLEILRQLTSQLVDLHRQHESLSIASNEFQQEVVDIYAGIQPQVQVFSTDFRIYQRKKKELIDKREQEANLLKEKDFVTFQVRELEEANIQIGELDLIETKLSFVQNQEEIFRKNQTIHSLLNDETGVLPLLQQAINELRDLNKIQPNYSELLTRLDSAFIEIEDISAQMNAAEIDEIDEEELEILSNRLDLINRLMNKHLVQYEDDLAHIQRELEAKMNQFSSLADEIDSLEKEIEQAERELYSRANELSEKRKKVQNEIEQHVSNLLAQVGLDKATFSIQIEEKELAISGKDDISMLFSANAGQPAQEIKQVASGGEIARLMLAIKSLIADKTTLSTMIFDEIDTGISGEVAQKVGNLLSQLAKNQQIISVTHLPQIASKGNHHLKIFKEELENQTRSRVAVLNSQSRVNEIAEMLSGANPSESALAAAREMVKPN